MIIEIQDLIEEKSVQSIKKVCSREERLLMPFKFLHESLLYFKQRVVFLKLNTDEISSKIINNEAILEK